MGDAYVETDILYSQDAFDGPLANYTIKKYHGHRAIPQFVAEEIDKLREEMLGST